MFGMFLAHDVDPRINRSPTDRDPNRHVSKTHAPWRAVNSLLGLIQRCGFSSDPSSQSESPSQNHASGMHPPPVGHGTQPNSHDVESVHDMSALYCVWTVNLAWRAHDERSTTE